MELIKISENNLVSARELHTFLESKERFSKWFERMKEFGFEENEDFTSVQKSTLVNNGAKKELNDFAISIDMAKEISMIQRNEKGKQARKYFIECERVLKAPTELDLIISTAKQMKAVKSDIARLENKFDSVVTLESSKQIKLQRAISARVYYRFGLNVDADIKQRKKYFANAYRDLKNKFGVASYKDVKVSEFDSAIEFIKNWIEDSSVREER